jgi:hypothetical protein
LKASTNKKLPPEVRAVAASWTLASRGLTFELKRAEALLGWPVGQHGLYQSGLDGVADAALARYGRTPPIDSALVVRALEDATVDTLARSRTLGIVLGALEKSSKKPTK